MTAGKEKERIDVLLVQRGYFDSREKARAAVMAGLVFVGTESVDKPGTKVPRDAALSVKGAAHNYVSRGGVKLEKALHTFGIDLKGAVMLDIGASTGGFTDCALQHGAAFVYAIDVGTNQLDWKIRTDPRVKVMEKTNFRYIRPEDLNGPPPTFAAVDVSFISLRHIFPPMRACLLPEGEAVTLIKPQFEAGREQVGKSGVVRDSKVHVEVVQGILQWAKQNGFYPKGLTYSPITGGKGNIEYLAYWTTHPQDGGIVAAEGESELIRRVVDEAQNMLAAKLIHQG